MEEIEPMRTAAFAFAAVGVLISGPSHAACAKPDIPACAVQKGAFPSGAGFDQCRKQMLVYKAEMERHSSCAKETGLAQEGQSAEEELEATLARVQSACPWRVIQKQAAAPEFQTETLPPFTVYRHLTHGFSTNSSTGTYMGPSRASFAICTAKAPVSPPLIP